MLSILWMILIGFIVGLLARFLKPGSDDMGFLLTTVVGIGGALFAGFVGRALGWYSENQPVGFLVSLIGAVVILFLAEAFMGRSKKNNL